MTARFKPPHGLRPLGALFIIGTFLSGCAEVSAAISGEDFASRAEMVKKEGGVIRPGEVGPYLDSHPDERMRTVIYRTLAQNRERLRAGLQRWTPLDLVALNEQSKRDMESSHQPLSKVAKEQYIWARLEGLQPGDLSRLIQGPYNTQVVDWIVDWESVGRPNVEGNLNRKDHEAVRSWAMERLPSSRYLLRWSLELDQRPGLVAGFLSQDWTDHQRVEILRMWCTSEGWSPLSHTETLLPMDSHAVKATLTRLDQSRDPLVRREAAKWLQWMNRAKGPRTALNRRRWTRK